MKLSNKLVIFGVTSSLSLPLLAGNLNSLAAPDNIGSAMFTIEDIYNRLNDGTTDTKRSGSFEEPSTGPTTGTGKTLDDVMGKAPVLDDTDGAAPADVKAGKKYWGLKSSSEWGLQTGTANIPSCTPDSSANPRFKDNGDGTVTDAYTCLMWLKDAGCVGTQEWANVDTSGKVVALIGAASPVCANYTATYTDWRLPSLSELIELSTSESKYIVKPSTPFTGVQAGYYGSSTTYAAFTADAWRVYLDDGGVYRGSKTFTNLIWPVRGGQ